MAHERRSRWQLHRTTIIVLLLSVITTSLAGVLVRDVMRRTEHRLLAQKASEGGMLLSSLMSQSYGTAGRGLGVLVTPHGVDPRAFAQASAMLTAPADGTQPGLGVSGVALVDLRSGRVLAGSGVQARGVGSAPWLATVNHALNPGGQLSPGDLSFVGVSTSARGAVMGMAVLASPGVATYLELPVRAELQDIGSGVGQPFGGLDFAVYAGSQEPDHLLWETKKGGKLDGETATTHADLNLNSSYAGGTMQGPLTVILSSPTPLVGRFAWSLPWLLGALGFVTTLVVALLTETMARRRSEAVALVGEVQARNREIEEAVARQEAAEERLRLAQRLEAVGQLAGGVAHDFNNLLAVMFSYLGFLREAGQGASWLEDVDEIEQAARRAADLTQQLLLFSRKESGRREVLDFAALIRDRSRLLQRTLGDHIEVVVRAPDRPLLVMADSTELDQVVMNLAVNARDAMPDGGRLVLLVERIHADGQTRVRLSVGDNGTGMSAEVAAHAFEPFYTTKEVGHGTGLGLATVYGIVQRSGGSVTIASKPGIGTTMTVDLPGIESPLPAARPLPDSPPRSCEGRVLVVEDEAAVRRATCRILEQAGFEVLAARSGAEALDIVAGREVDVVVSDVVMPGGLNGADLAEGLRTTHPELGVVLVTGYGRDHLDRFGNLPDGIQLLQKPYASGLLVQAVRRGLEPQGAHA